MKRILSVILFLCISFSSFSQINSFPWTDDFESFSNCGLVCAGPCNLSGGWTNVTNDGAEWLVDQGGTSSFNTGPSIDHNPGTSAGNYLYTETSGCNNQTANLISPTFDFSFMSNPTVNFWWHMFGVAMGTMHFDLDTGSGTWIQDVVPSWTANVDQWQNREINLTNLAGSKSNVRFRIRGQTGTTFTSDMAIDDFRIFNDIPNDLALTQIISPTQECGITGVKSIQIEIKNVGASDQNNFSLAYQINQEPPVVQQYIGLLQSDDSDVFTFQTTYNFSPAEDYKLKTWIIFPQDLNNLNDTLSLGIKEAFPLEIVDFAGFTGGNLGNAVPGWKEGKGNTSPSGTSSNWTASDSLQQSFFGVNTAKVNLSGNTNNEWIVSPPIVISNSARLFFSSAVTSKDGIQNASMGSDDKLQVFVSTDCGSTFSSIFVLDVSSNLSNSLREFAVNLNSYVNQEIILGFKAQDGPQNDIEDYDLHITLIEAKRVFPNDVGIIDFRTQDGDKIIAANTGEEIFVRLKNFGSNTVSNIPILSKVGNVNFQNIYYGSLASNAEVEIKLGAYFGSITGSPNIKVRSFTLFNGDTINSNDTLNAILLVDGATNIDLAQELEGVTINPNPFKNNLRIEISENLNENYEIQLTDLSGRIIEQFSSINSSLNINMEEFPSGMYFLRIKGQSTSKIIKCLKE